MMEPEERLRVGVSSPRCDLFFGGRAGTC
jgi:hypothetical protein